MNRVVIVSDSHSMKRELVEITRRHKADLYIHCGDSELSNKSNYLKGYATVRGNCDWSGKFPKEETIDIGGLRFYVTHGHLYSVKSTLLHLQYRALEHDANIVCYGHSHIAHVEKSENLLMINPGSIRSPRVYKDPSYCVLEWENRNEIKIEFYHVNGEKIDHFPFPNKISL